MSLWVAGVVWGLAWAAPPVPEPELVWVPTQDGYYAALHHQARPGAPAVVLCHGISSNAQFWDLAPDRSLADTLWAAGFDVWNLDLRGHGQAVRDPQGERQPEGWTVDDYGLHDLPAVFDLIEERSPGQPVHFVGHSMGGMVLAVYLAHHPQTPLRSAVTVGSPLDFRDPDVLFGALFGVAPAVAHTRFIHTESGAKLVALFRRQLIGTLDTVFHNPENMSPQAERLMFRRVVSPVSRGELGQFALAATDGEFHSADGEMIYRNSLDQVTVPMLFIAGRADHIVSPDRAYAYYEAVGSEEKAFVIASVANGMHGDYGHLDLGVGDHAAQDIYPEILRWLEAHP